MKRKTISVILLAVLILLVMSPLATSLESSGQSETGHTLGYIALSLVILVIVLGFVMRMPGIRGTPRKRIIRIIHMIVALSALGVIIAHVLTVTG